MGAFDVLFQLSDRSSCVWSNVLATPFGTQLCTSYAASARTVLQLLQERPDRRDYTCQKNSTWRADTTENWWRNSFDRSKQLNEGIGCTVRLAYDAMKCLEHIQKLHSQEATSPTETIKAKPHLGGRQITEWLVIACHTKIYMKYAVDSRIKMDQTP